MVKFGTELVLIVGLWLLLLLKWGELENVKLKHLSKKTKTTAIVWVNKLAIYNNVNGKMTKKHLTRGTKVRVYAIATH